MLVLVLIGHQSVITCTEWQVNLHELWGDENLWSWQKLNPAAASESILLIHWNRRVILTLTFLSRA